MSFRLPDTAVAGTAGACTCVGGAPDQLLRMRQTAELWIAGEISRSVKLCLQGASARTSLCDSAPCDVLGSGRHGHNTTTERVGSESELGELSLTPHRLLSPRITRWETSRHGVGVLLKKSASNAHMHRALRLRSAAAACFPLHVPLTCMQAHARTRSAAFNKR